jgi:penicillin-binding protein 1C
MDPAAVALVTDALSDPLARLRLLHGRSPFDLGFPVAVKTGTSSGHRDTWAVGYTRERTVAVWVGRADGARAGDLTGAGAAGPLFGDAMRRAMRDVPGRAPLWDEGLLASVPVCPLSGRVAGPACPEAVSRRFAANVAPHGTCDVHRHVRSVRVHGRQVHRCDARARDVVAVLPGEYDAWLASLPPGAPGRDPDGIPWVTAADTQACGLAASRPVLALSEPLDGTVLLRDADGGAQVEVQADLVGGDARSHAALGELEILVDDRVVARADAARQARLSLGPGDHAILARPVDGRLAVQIRSVRVSVR